MIKYFRMTDIPIVKWDKKTEGADAEYYNKVQISTKMPGSGSS